MSKQIALPGLLVAPGRQPGVPDAAMQCSDDTIESATMTVLAGTLPPGLRGHVFVVAPKAVVGEPIWGGEPVIWRFDMDDAGMTITKKFVCNPQWFARRAIEDDDWFSGLRHGAFAFGNVGAGFFISRMLGVQDMQNIAPIPLSPTRMMITSDNGRPWILDPRSLEVVRPLGMRTDWKVGLPIPWPFDMVITTAHPVLDKDSEKSTDRWLYSTNFMPKAPVIQAFTHLIRWRVRDQRMQHFRLIDAATGEPMQVEETLHQLQVTANHVVLLESAFKVNFWLLALGFLTKFGIPEWMIDMATSSPDYPFARVWVVKKSDLVVGDGPNDSTAGPDDPVDVVATPFALAGESWHFVTAYNDAEGIDLFVLHTPTADISHYLGAGQPMLDGAKARAELDGWFTNYGLRPGELGRHRIHVEEGTVISKRSAETKVTWGLGIQAYRYQSRVYDGGDAPRIFMSSGGFYRKGMPRAFHKLYGERAPRVAELPEETPGAIFSFDPITEAIDSWELPSGWLALTPTYIPPMEWSKSDGWHENDTAPDTDGHLHVVAVSDPTDALPEGSSGTEVWIFEAGDLAKGPVCRLGLAGLTVGATVHSCWTEQIQSFGEGAPWNVEEDYNLDGIEAAYQSVIPDWLPGKPVWDRVVNRFVKMDQVRSLFEEEIYPRFPGGTRRPGTRHRGFRKKR